MIRRGAAHQRDGASSASGRFRYDLQGLRAVAVLLIVLAHAGVSFLRGGYVGVDVFFVLSEFLINKSAPERGAHARRHRCQPPSPEHFWSLSVEEQFYIAWPAVLAPVLFAPWVARWLRHRRCGWKPGRVGELTRLLVVIGAAAVASLAWSITQTRTHPASA